MLKETSKTLQPFIKEMGISIKCLCFEIQESAHDYIIHLQM